MPSGSDRDVDAELPAFIEAALCLGRGTEASREPDLAEGRKTVANRKPTRCRRDRQCDREIGARLFDPHTACDVHEDVGAAQAEPGVAREDGDDHRKPLRIDARPDTARHRQVGGRDERLNLEQEWPRAFEHAPDRCAYLPRARRAEELGRVRHTDEAGRGHLEHSELVRGPEPVLRRPQDTMLVVAVALELEHAIHEMLEHAGTRHGAVLRHMPDEDGRDVVVLRDPQETARSLSYLRDGSGSRADVRRVQRLHRVDDAHVGMLALDGGTDDLERGLGEDAHRLRTADSRRTKGDLRRGLLARHEQCPLAGASDRTEDAQEERRLADTRLTGDEHDRGRNEAAAENPVELRNRGRHPRCLVRGHVTEEHGRSRRNPPASSAGRNGVLDERPERPAAGTLAEPARAPSSALRAHVLGRGPGHRASLGAAPDANRHGSASIRLACRALVLKSPGDTAKTILER